MSIITIYHNPACGTSRNVLGLIRNSGEEPTLIEYLKTPPDRATLKELITALGVPVREVLRIKDTPYGELEVERRRTGRLHAPASDSHQSAHRGHAAGHAPVPTV